MEEKNYSQLELFGQLKSGQDRDIRQKVSVFSQMRRHEKTIIMIIAFMVTSLVSFSLGVEKGKRLVSLKGDNRFDLAKTQPAAAEQAQKSQTPAASSEDGQKNADPVLSAQGYTIQLASFKTKNFAQQEANSLKRKGFSPLILPKGKFTILCVGNFPNKDKAQAMLPEFRKRYNSCYIRRL